MRNPARLLVACAALAVATTGLAGCGAPTRSVKAYCAYFYGAGGKLRQRYLDADRNMNSDPLRAIGTALGAPKDLANFFHHLAKRAPDDISDDVETLADAFDQQAQSAGDAVKDPMGALAGGLISGLATMGPAERVDSYTNRHCGPPPGTSAARSNTGATATPTPTDTPAPASTGPYTGAAGLATGEEIAISCHDDEIDVYAFARSAPAVRLLTSVRTGDSGWLGGWTDVTTDACRDRDQWSGDFGALLFSGQPAGELQSHIGYLDLVHGSVHDLTAPRQGSDFSATLLNEREPRFLGPGGGKVVFGSDTVAFTDSAGDDEVTTTGDPTKASALSRRIDPDEHPETAVTSDSSPASGLSYNPSYTLALRAGQSGGYEAVRVPAAAGTAAVGCLTSERSWTLVGWADDGRAAFSASGENDTVDVRIVTIDPHTLHAGCGANIMPPNNRSPRDLQLLPNGSAITFNADSTTGTTTFQLPLTGGTPTPYTPPTLPTPLTFWTK